MKATILFATVLFLSTVAFSQEVETKNSTSASVSATTAKPNTLAKATAKADQSAKRTTGMVKSEKNAAKQDIKSDATLVKSTGEQSEIVSANSKTDVYAHSSIKDNKSGQSASLNSRNSVSSTGVDKQTTDLKNNGKAAVQSGSNAAIETGNSAKTDVKEIKTKTSAQAHSVQKCIKPRPASVKMNARVSNTARIRIK